jgi:hypothetical protein
MAKATRKEIPVVIPAPVVEYTLVLSQEEAEAIRDISYKVGGYPSETRRGLFDAIRSALHGAGMGYDYEISDIAFEYGALVFRPRDKH